MIWICTREPSCPLTPDLNPSFLSGIATLGLERFHQYPVPSCSSAAPCTWSYLLCAANLHSLPRIASRRIPAKIERGQIQKGTVGTLHPARDVPIAHCRSKTPSPIEDPS